MITFAIATPRLLIASSLIICNIVENFKTVFFFKKALEILYIVWHLKQKVIVKGFYCINTRNWFIVLLVFADSPLI